MNSKGIISFLALGILPLTGSFAETLTFNDTVVMLNDTNAVINLSQFDNGAGGAFEGATLNSITVTVETRVLGANVQLDNDETIAQTGTGRVQNQVNSFTVGASVLKSDFATTVGAGGTALQLNVSQAFALDATSGDTVGQFDNTGAGDFASWTPGTLTASDSGSLASAVFSQYEGTGSIAFTVNSTFTTSATFDGSNGFFQGNTPSGQFFAQVVYDYSPSVVPEPSTYALLAGLMAFSAIALRKRK